MTFTTYDPTETTLRNIVDRVRHCHKQEAAIIEDFEHTPGRKWATVTIDTLAPERTIRSWFRRIGADVGLSATNPEKTRWTALFSPELDFQLPDTLPLPALELCRIKAESVLDLFIASNTEKRWMLFEGLKISGQGYATTTIRSNYPWSNVGQRLRKCGAYIRHRETIGAHTWIITFSVEG